MLATVAGWGAHYLPGAPTSAAAEGTVRQQPEPASGEPGRAEGAGAEAGDDVTSFVTSCGKLLDVVPVSATAARAAVEVTLELHPVCPTGEWVSSRAFNIRLADSGDEAADEASTVAEATFDFEDERLFVPGYGDPTSRIVVRYGPGTAWSDPDTMTRAIHDGTIVVACEARDGAKPEPAEEGEVDDAATLYLASKSDSGGGAGETPEETALAALRRQAASDDASVSELEGAWVAQLSSKKQGTHDDYEGRTYSLSDIYQQFLELRLKYPNVRLLNSSDWGSYTLPDYWVTIAGVPYKRPGQPNGWCAERGIAPSQCFAKKLVRHGDAEGTTRHRD